MGGGSDANVENRIKKLAIHDAVDSWFEIGGDLYVYFSSCGAYRATAVGD